jgi:hypothetical protein
LFGAMRTWIQPLARGRGLTGVVSWEKFGYTPSFRFRRDLGGWKTHWLSKRVIAWLQQLVFPALRFSVRQFAATNLTILWVDSWFLLVYVFPVCQVPSLAKLPCRHPPDRRTTGSRYVPEFWRSRCNARVVSFSCR